MRTITTSKRPMAGHIFNDKHLCSVCGGSCEAYEDNKRPCPGRPNSSPQEEISRLAAGADESCAGRRLDGAGCPERLRPGSARRATGDP